MFTKSSHPPRPIPSRCRATGLGQLGYLYGCAYYRDRTDRSLAGLHAQARGCNKNIDDCGIGSDGSLRPAVLILNMFGRGKNNTSSLFWVLHTLWDGSFGSCGFRVAAAPRARARLKMSEAFLTEATHTHCPVELDRVSAGAAPKKGCKCMHS